MFVYLAFVIIAQFLYGCWVGIQPVQSQTRVNITKHNLPQKRLEPVFGSKKNGSCTHVSHLNGRLVCNGTSVLNDDFIPGINTSNPTWASELFTLSGTSGDIRLSFEIDSESHDRMELAVFNCPEMRINLPSFSVYFDGSFRPDRNDLQLGTLIMESQLVNTSCDQLLVFCMKYNTTQPPTRFINLVIPNDNSSQIFLGEVTFLHESNESCDLVLPTIGPITTTTTNGGDTSSNATELYDVSIVVVLVLVSIIVVVVIVIVLLVIVRLKAHKHRYDSSKVHQLQNVNVVLDPETREDENVEESYLDSQYDVIDKPPQNEVKTGTNTCSATIMDALYSNPDEAITDETYSHLRDSQKKNISPQEIAAAGYEYSQLNHSQINPVDQKSGPSPAQQEPTDVGMLYAVPDKKKKTSNKALGVPVKSSEFIEYLNSKEVGTVSSGMDLSECSQTMTDPVVQRSRPTPALQESVDVEKLYAIPDKKKKVSK